MANVSEKAHKTGRRGDSFNSDDLRKRTNIGEDGKVKVTVVASGLIGEAAPPIEEILKLPPIIRTTTKEIEKVSEKIQKEEGVYG